MSPRRRRILYSGRVQGVGFRFTAERLARARTVSGYVRNLPDGRVEIVVEGELSEIEAFLNSVRTELGNKIHSEASEDLSLDESGFEGFTIQY